MKRRDVILFALLCLSIIFGVLFYDFSHPGIVTREMDFRISFVTEHEISGASTIFVIPRGKIRANRDIQKIVDSFNECLNKITLRNEKGNCYILRLPVKERHYRFLPDVLADYYTVRFMIFIRKDGKTAGGASCSLDVSSMKREYFVETLDPISLISD